MTTVKDQFIAELEPLLKDAEKAIVANDVAKARWLSLSMLKLVKDYSDKLSRDEIRDALNNPTAAAIAARLGVQP